MLGCLVIFLSEGHFIIFFPKPLTNPNPLVQKERCHLYFSKRELGMEKEGDRGGRFIRVQ